MSRRLYFGKARPARAQWHVAQAFQGRGAASPGAALQGRACMAERMLERCPIAKRAVAGGADDRAMAARPSWRGLAQAGRLSETTFAERLRQICQRPGER